MGRLQERGSGLGPHRAKVRWLAGAATLAAALIAQPITAAAEPAGGVAPPSTSVTLPPLSSVPTSITDGQSVQSLFNQAVGPLPSGDQPRAVPAGVVSGQSPVTQATVPPSFASQTTQTSGTPTSTVPAAVASTQVQLEVAQVRLHQAQSAADVADARAAASRQRARDAQAASQSLDGALRQVALLLYTSGGPGSLAPDPAAGQVSVFASAYAEAAFPIDAIAARQHDAAVEAQALSAARAAQKSADRDLAQAHTALQAAQTLQQSLQQQLSSLPSSVSAGLAAEDAAVAAQAGAELTSPSALQFRPANSLSTPVATTTVALAWAFAELGKPYQWGGTGPDSFDCSGLTQYAWRQAGVQIPRVAADQYAWTIPVPLSQLLPGDLVFFGQTDIHHVGIYIGQGLMINAPHTGDVVRVSSIWWSDLAGFGRVHAAGVPVPLHTPPSAQQPAPAAVVPAAGPVPSQTSPPPGWQPTPGASAPLAVTPPPPTTTTPDTTPSTPSTTGTTTTTAPPATTSTTKPPSDSTTTASTTAPSP